MLTNEQLQKMDQRTYGFILIVEKVIVRALVAMMLVTVLIATVELAILLLRDLAAPPFDLLTISEMLEVFGFFMMILIGIELMDTVKSYITDHHVRVESVINVALIAIARKVIVMEPKAYPAPVLLAVAAIVVALGATYYLVRTRNEKG